MSETVTESSKPRRINERIVTQWNPHSRRHSGMVEWAVCQLLRKFAAQVSEDQEIVELGAFKGRSTGWLLLGAQDGRGAHVTTVDPWDLRQDAYSGYSHRYVAARAEFDTYLARIGASDAVHTTVQGFAHIAGREWARPLVGFLYHDAQHTTEAVEADLRAWKPHIAPGGIVVLHDAADPRYGVVEGAERILSDAAWDWQNRRLMPWFRYPGRRGALIVRRQA